MTKSDILGIVALGGLAVAGFFLMNKQKENTAGYPVGVEANNEDDIKFNEALIKSNMLAEQAAALQQQGMDNAKIANALLAAQNATENAQKQATQQTIQVRTQTAQNVSVPGTRSTQTIGNKTYTSYYAPGVKVIANKSGKNYANLGAGSDASKW